MSSGRQKCVSESVIYKATVRYNDKEQFYIGSTARKFKTRYYKHMHSFRNKNLKESTKLSSFIHAAKFNEDVFENGIKWSINHKTNQCKPSRIYSLCNTIERLEKALADKNHPLTPELN